MADRKFTIIKGGLDSPTKGRKHFVSAFITDTRLMGVVGMYIHWRVSKDLDFSDFHQFFYFDSEEYGFETYRSIYGNDLSELAMIEQTLIGGLGGHKIEINEQEAKAYIQQYAELNKKFSLPLPEPKHEYSNLLDDVISLSHLDKKHLIEKCSAEITSDYQLINYFLMRIFGKDFDGAMFLISEGFRLDIYPEFKISTLCKNTIDFFERTKTGEHSTVTYLCESLIEYDNSYTLVVSQVTLQDLKIINFSRCSDFRISPAEAAMMLTRPEFVTVYDVLLDPENLEDGLADVASSAIITVHENGKLFLSFNKHNDHVNSRIFRLNEDISGLYYITDYGQLLIGSYSLSGIHNIEKGLRKSKLDQFLFPSSKYEFKEPVLYEFIQSDFEDFEDFLEFIKE